MTLPRLGALAELVPLPKRCAAACLDVPNAAPITAHESPAPRAAALASRRLSGVTVSSPVSSFLCFNHIFITALQRVVEPGAYSVRVDDGHRLLDRNGDELEQVSRRVGPMTNNLSSPSYSNSASLVAFSPA